MTPGDRVRAAMVPADATTAGPKGTLVKVGFEEMMKQVSEAVYEAMQDERERCAKIAEACECWPEDPCCGGYLAKKIREGHRP